MEILNLMLDGVGLIAKILGFIALYSIAIALTDWRKTERYQRKLKELQDD